MQTYFHRHRTLFLHLSFWSVYLSFYLYQISVFQRDRGYDWEKLLPSLVSQLFFTASIAYLNYFYLLPRFIRNKSLWKYLLGFVLCFTLAVAGRVVLQRYIMDGYTHEVKHFYSSFFIVQIVAITLLIVIFIAMLKFADEWFDLEAKKKEIENVKLTAELNFLKAQINPHFLFNTLNNLYYLAYSKSPNTTEVIEKLSQMMRYMIYECNHPMVPLSKEVEYMKNYISLEQLRLNNEVPVRFEVEGNAHETMIAPLIFITFLENAFKHGVGKGSGQAWINVFIQVTPEACMYRVENSIVQGSGENKLGIGMNNARRRLELSYPHKHEMTVNSHSDRYIVEIKIMLK